MAVRTPLKNDSGNLKEMTSAEVDQIVDQVVYQYSLNPSVTLSYVSSGGNLGTINDTRLQAGAGITRIDRFATQAETEDVSTITTSFSKINSASASVTPTTDTGKTWPAYYNASGHIQAMSLQDVKDTFLHPAVDLLTAATTTADQAGTYHISSSSSVVGSTLVSANPVFTDTRADGSAYTASGLIETRDQPTTITNYYLHRINGSAPTFTVPFFINTSNNLQEYTTATFNSLLQEWIRYTAASSTDGYSISYNLGTTGSGSIRGTGMTNTTLVSSTYATLQVTLDDYRAQEFPSGVSQSINTYYLRINKS